MREDTLLRNRLATLLHETDLLRHFSKPTDNLLISIVEGKDSVGNTGVATKLQNILLGTSEVVARHARVEVVDRLELEATVEEVQPGRAIHVHGRTQHLLGEGFVDAQVGGGHGEVGQCDLHMQGRGHNVGHHEEDEAATPVGNRLVQHEVDVPVPEEHLAGDLEIDVPPGGSLLRGLAFQQVLPAEAVEVEAGQRHDGVV